MTKTRLLLSASVALTAGAVVVSAQATPAPSASSAQAPVFTAGTGTEKVGPSIEEELSHEYAGGLAETPLQHSEGEWLQTQASLGDAAAQIEADFPDDFAYDFFGDQGYVIAFRAQPPVEAVDLLEAAGLPFEVVDDVGFTQLDYLDQVDEVSRSLEPLVSKETQVVVSPDPMREPGSIKVRILGSVPVQRSASSPPASDIVVDEPFSVSVETDPASDLFELNSYNRAAGTWLINSSGIGECTSGFVAKSTTSDTLGLLTAGHCPKSLRYYNPQNGDVYGLEFRSSSTSTSGDTMFLRSPNMMDAWFHAGATTGRPVYEVRNPRSGEQVCRYGRATNNVRCNPAYDINTTIQSQIGSSTYTIGRQALVDQPTTLGDSGGPVFGGNTAMGILSSGAGNTSSFTLISYAQSARGVSVCKHPVCS